MGILGIGVDIVRMPRVAGLVVRRGERPLAYRILSPREAENFQQLSQVPYVPPPEHESDTDVMMDELGKKDSRWHRRIRYLSVRWAVKEAAFKAMNSVVRPTWKELTYETLGKWSTGQPRLTYHPQDESKIKAIGKLSVSVSHDGDYVVAQVVAEESDIKPMPGTPSTPSQSTLAQRLFSRRSERVSDIIPPGAVLGSRRRSLMSRKGEEKEHPSLPEASLEDETYKKLMD